MRSLGIWLGTVFLKRAVLVALAVGFFSPAGHATDKSAEALTKNEHHLDERNKEYVSGVPADPTPDWTMASGGRLYDNWMQETDRKAQEGSRILAEIECEDR